MFRLCYMLMNIPVASPSSWMNTKIFTIDPRDLHDLISVNISRIVKYYTSSSVCSSLPRLFSGMCHAIIHYLTFAHVIFSFWDILVLFLLLHNFYLSFNCHLILRLFRRLNVRFPHFTLTNFHTISSLWDSIPVVISHDL